MEGYRSEFVFISPSQLVTWGMNYEPAPPREPPRLHSQPKSIFLTWNYLPIVEFDYSLKKTLFD